jgi:hypothetical protein
VEWRVGRRTGSAVAPRCNKWVTVRAPCTSREHLPDHALDPPHVDRLESEGTLTSRLAPVPAVLLPRAGDPASYPARSFWSFRGG